MPSIVATPNPARIGQPVVVVGEGFGNAVEVTITIAELGIAAEVVSAATGAFASDGLADHATVTLTGTGQPGAGETFTLGTTVYTMRATLATIVAANEILIGGALTNTLDNIKAAVNGDLSGAGTLYHSNTVRHPDIMATNKTATTVVFHARVAGTAGNSLASTETLANNSFGGATLSGGAAALAKAWTWTPARYGTFLISATDGTNSATTLARVFSS